jgi:hypothetical protein
MQPFPAGHHAAVESFVFARRRRTINSSIVRSSPRSDPLIEPFADFPILLDIVIEVFGREHLGSTSGSMRPSRNLAALDGVESWADRYLRSNEASTSLTDKLTRD